MDKIKLGGQAVIEGIMLKSAHFWTLGLRLPDGSIHVESKPLTAGQRLKRLWKLPVVRGFKALIEAVTLGYKALSISAYKAAQDEEEGIEMGFGHMVLAIAVSVAGAVSLFIAMPAFFARALYSTPLSPFFINLFEGLFKIFVLVVYIWVISRLEDIERVFEYHGAEHAVIHAYERNELLEPNAKMAKNIRHMRCGTSFLVLVMITSILIFSLIGRPPFVERVLYHLAIVPVVAGISYEIIKFAAKYSGNIFVKLIMAPGMSLQRMTTRKPDESQMQVAIETLNELVRLETENQKSA